ncbi:nitroreductase family protein [Ruminococcus flavefaciens]|uniref:Nitroreductase n=1 Tax=Ruminococcus flavefaciens TaxID=1265 RepID=A0A315XVE7_RUMFL|nr:nitroreductase family protein [Ruminococcus flavefaciens]PWJ10812.1 nitroreductase [Ruminococcus flavefaciens]SSA51388.1 Nitroreductase [Ruminococcus flavefaciens]
MDFTELSESRYSVRKFKDRPVSKEHMQIILRAAQLAPTGCNYQPQRIYVAESEEAIGRLNEISRCIFGAKTVLVFTYNEDEEWKNPLEKGRHSGEQDVSIVASHVMLQAWELGIGTCWVNYFSNSRLEKELGLPENERSVLIIPMGYPAEDASPLAMHSEYKDISDIVRYL